MYFEVPFPIQITDRIVHFLDVTFTRYGLSGIVRIDMAFSLSLQYSKNI